MELTIGPVRRCYLVEEFQWIRGRRRAEQIPGCIMPLPPRAYVRKKEKCADAIVRAYINGITNGIHKRDLYARKRRRPAAAQTEAQKPKKRGQDQLAALRDKRWKRAKALVYSTMKWRGQGKCSAGETVSSGSLRVVF